MQQNESTMGMSPPRAATQDWLDDLAAERLLAPDEWRGAAEVLRGSAPWRLAADRLLALAGTCLVLAGVVFFFAYNWRVMPPIAKFAVIELALVLAVFVALRRGLEDLVGRLCALTASVMVGVFLAVFGQVYQTGADPWHLFAAWAALITPWSALVRFGPLWALWLGVLDLAVVLYIGETWRGSESAACLALAAMHVVALAARERFARTDDAVAHETWLRQAILGVLLAALLVPTFILLGREHTVLNSDLAGFLAWIAVSAVAWRWFSAHAPDLFSLCLVALSACLAILYGVGAVILPHADVGAFLVFALIVLAVFSGAAFVLRAEMRRMLSQGRAVE